MNPVLLGTLQAGYAASLAPSWVRFARAASEPQAAQLRRLGAIVADNVGCSYGRAHHFDQVTDLRSFRARVPIARFDELNPWIERIARGEPAVLTRQPVLMMERTSGSTRANKLVPFTRVLLAEVAAATHPWLFDLLTGIPALRGTRSYWSISPVGRARHKTEGGIPIGMDDDTAYFGPLARWLLAETLAVPSSVARLESVERWRRETCLHLLRARDLGLVSVWSPTFLTLLMEAIERDFDDLLDLLPWQRAAELRREVARHGGQLSAELLWPSLSLVSCWTDGPSCALVPSVRRWFPRTRLQPKGLLATEGVVSVPLLGAVAPVLAVAGHFLEFIDVQQPGREPLLAHELGEGATYSPLLTTSGGLYRYHLQDVIRCVGHWRATPCVRFEGRLDCVSDLAGEKLDARIVGEAIAQATAKLVGPWQFVMLAPALGSPARYRLYVESARGDRALEALALEVEQHLLRGAHYAYCRALGQLGPVEAYRVRAGARGLESRRAAEGGRLGDLKPSPLDRRTGWESFFALPNERDPLASCDDVDPLSRDE